MNIKFAGAIAALLCCASLGVRAGTLTVYHDADYSIHSESAVSMAMGFKTALTEVGNRIQGFDIEFVVKEHRGNSKRSLHHMQQFLDAPSALLERLRREIAAQPFQFEGLTPHLTVSGGFTSFHCGGQASAVDLLAHANAALYQAKGDGRDRIDYSACDDTEPEVSANG